MCSFDPSDLSDYITNLWYEEKTITFPATGWAIKNRLVQQGKRKTEMFSKLHT